MREYVLFIDYPEKTSVEETKAFLQSHVENFTIVCTDGLKVVQYMYEAFRGYMIAQGKSIGRHPIRSVEIERENGGHIEEAIFLYRGVPVNAKIGDNMLLLRAFSDSNEWSETLKNEMLLYPSVTKIDIAISEPTKEIFGIYADIERRLEVGDIDGGPHISQDHPIGYFQENFPKYRHLFHYSVENP